MMEVPKDKEIRTQPERYNAFKCANTINSIHYVIKEKENSSKRRYIEKVNNKTRDVNLVVYCAQCELVWPIPKGDC